MDIVTIAFFDSTYWLVTGERHLDRLLEGREMPECDIAFVTCATWDEVMDLWETPGGSMPWAIHPKIVQRLKVDLVSGDDDEGWGLNLK